MSNVGFPGSERPAFVTVAEVAAELRVTQRFVRHMIATGDLRAVKVGSRIVRIRHDDVEALIKPIGGVA